MFHQLIKKFSSFQGIQASFPSSKKLATCTLPESHESSLQRPIPYRGADKSLARPGRKKSYSDRKF